MQCATGDKRESRKGAHFGPKCPGRQCVAKWLKGEWPGIYPVKKKISKKCVW